MSASQHLRRRQQLLVRFDEIEIDTLLVADPANVRYLTGFTGSNGALLMTRNGETLFTDPRYEIQAAEQTNCRVRILRGPLMSGVVTSLKRRRVKRIGFDPMRMSHAEYSTLRESLPGNAALVAVSGVVDELRQIKSEDEIEAIRAAVQLASKAYTAAMRRAKPGVREVELAAEIDYRMRRLGAERPSFETIVASGPRSALPHAAPTSKKLQSKEPLLVDMGAQLNGYASDMTRMAFLGRPGRKARELYAAVLEAQLAALEAIRPGRPAAAVDQAARQVLKKNGLDKLFVHSTGHGLGLEIHEGPRIGRGGRERLVAGMVITVEPGVYMDGFGGIRIEDTVVVTRGGFEVLTPTSKELLVI